MSEPPKLNKTERAFLARYHISESHVADMRHRFDWQSCSDELREEGRWFAWGFRRCGEKHRLTNGRGACIQCKPATIAFVMRHARPGFLYIAISVRAALVKVGITLDLDDRMQQLNAHRLAGQDDWGIFHSEYCERPAALEAELHRRLSHYAVPEVFDRKGGGRSRETFDCTAAEALATLASIAVQLGDK